MSDHQLFHCASAENRRQATSYNVAMDSSTINSQQDASATHVEPGVQTDYTTRFAVLGPSLNDTYIPQPANDATSQYLQSTIDREYDREISEPSSGNMIADPTPPHLNTIPDFKELRGVQKGNQQAKCAPISY
jgi:hypothetical protein